MCSFNKILFRTIISPCLLIILLVIISACSSSEQKAIEYYESATNLSLKNKVRLVLFKDTIYDSFLADKELYIRLSLLSSKDSLIRDLVANQWEQLDSLSNIPDFLNGIEPFRPHNKDTIYYKISIDATINNHVVVWFNKSSKLLCLHDVAL
jgi:uncharacterized membrane protein YvbJ